MFGRHSPCSRSTMTSRRAIFPLCLLVAGCAPLALERPAPGDRMTQAADLYVACVSREAEKNMENPAGAEDIATAAHGSCWTEWESYGAATRASFGRNAVTSGEIQFAEDGSEGHIRQFERETRRGIVDTIVSRSLKKTSKP